MNTPYVFKKCKACNNWLVANTYNFHRSIDGKYNIKSKCKNCRKIETLNIMSKKRFNIYVHNITLDMHKDMIKYFNNRCAYTGELLEEINFSFEHIKPNHLKGEHAIWNIIPCSRSINSSKGDNDFLTWYKEQFFYDKDRLYKIYSWQLYALDKWGE